MVRSILISLIFLCIADLMAQRESEDISLNNQFWIDYNRRYNLDEQKSISGFVGYRTINPHIFDKILLVPTYNILHTRSPEFLNLKKPLINSFHLGTGLYYTSSYRGADNFEFRLMQGFKFFLPSIKSIPLKNYVRMEERLQKTFNGSGWNTAFRFRYRISTIIEWKKHLLSFNKGMYIPFNIEIFFNIKKADRFNDVIRISPGIGYKINDEWKAELYASYNHSNNTSPVDNSSDDFVFRLRLYHIGKKKGKAVENREEEIKELIE